MPTAIRARSSCAGPEIRARATVIAEGCRGSLAKKLIAQYALDAGRSPQTFALGLKELWQLPPGRVETGLIQHSLGWPLHSSEYGGSLIYHLADNQAYVGYVVGLDYKDPRLSPFEAFQQFKHHPMCARCSMAANSSPRVRAPLPRVAGNPARGSTCPGRCWSGMPAGR